MKSGLVAAGAAAGLGPAAAGEEPSLTPDPTRSKAFAMRGVYFHDGFTVEPKDHAPLYWGETEWRREVEWLRACGINAIEFATMLEFNRIPSTDMEREKIANRLRILDLAHEYGMEFGYLLTNTVVSTVPPDEPPSHQLKDRAVMLCPQDPANFEKTVALQSWYMETYREADFFDEFPADWGACHCGVCNVSDFLRYVRAFSDKARELNPRSRVYANTWCISYWGENPIPKGWKTVFDGEIVGTREVIEALPSMPDNVHLAMPCHHLYRPLAYESYGGKSKTPVFPTEADLRKVRDAGRQIMAWPHFVMDDDVGRRPQWGLVHCEARYIQAMLRALRGAGIDRVMGNLYLPYLQIANTYVYGRLLEDPDQDLAALLQDFARLVVVAEDAPALAEVLAWMDNHSYWHEQNPPDAQLPELPVTLTKETAARVAAGLRPNPSPELPVPISAERWLSDLAASIDRMTWVS